MIHTVGKAHWISSCSVSLLSTHLRETSDALFGPFPVDLSVYDQRFDLLYCFGEANEGRHVRPTGARRTLAPWPAVLQA